MPPVVDTHKHYRARPHLLTKKDRDGLLVYIPGEVAVHALNETMAEVFALCDGDTPCEEIVVRLAQQHRADVGEVSRATYHALRDLRDRGLIEAV